MLPAPLWLALVRAMLVVEDGTRITPLSLHGEGGVKDKWERLSQVRRLREHPIHRCAVPLPPWGRLRNEDAAFLAPSKRIHAYVEKQYRRTKPSPRG